MKKFLFIFLMLLLPGVTSAITLPWSSTFNCTDWNQGSNLSCDGFNVYDANNVMSCTSGPQTSVINSAGNNPNGGGGKGWRVSIDDGNNQQAASPYLSLSTPVPELWMRFYIHYPLGFAWGSLNWHKWVYIYGTGNYSGVFEPVGTVFRLYDQSHSVNYYSANNIGWYSMMGGNVGDGLWHYVEMHIKTDTNGSNGIFQAWVDGSKVIDSGTVNYSGQNFSWFVFNANNSSPANGGCAYVDYDDFAISTTGYIGPISPAGPTPQTSISGASISGGSIH